MTNKVKRIVWLSDCSKRTGAGIVSYNICSRLAQSGIEVFHLGAGFDSEEFIERGKNYKLLPAGPVGAGGTISDTAAQVFMTSMRQIKPDLAVIYADPYMVSWLMQYQCPVPLLFYAILDGYTFNDKLQLAGGWPPKLSEILDRASVVIVPSKFSQKIANVSSFANKTVTIPHGVDTATFKPPV